MCVPSDPPLTVVSMYREQLELDEGWTTLECLTCGTKSQWRTDQLARLRAQLRCPHCGVQDDVPTPTREPA